MKKILIALTLFGYTVIAKSQNVSVEKSTYGVQVGIIGVWVHNESRLSNQIALRSELGFDPGVLESNSNDQNSFFLTPTITLEPKWYYNLNKRDNKSKRVDGNSGDFLSIKTTYYPDWFVISSESDINLTSAISIIPTWGIRRNIGNHFNYEVGLGIGYIRYFKKDETLLFDESDLITNLHLRIGYKF